MSYVLRLSTYIFLDFIMFLRYLVVNNHIPEPSIQKKIANYLIMVFGQTQAHYLCSYPKQCPNGVRSASEMVETAFMLQSPNVTTARIVKPHLYGCVINFSLYISS